MRASLARTRRSSHSSPCGLRIGSRAKSDVVNAERSSFGRALLFPVRKTGEEAEITEGIDEEMESMRRVEQRVAEFAARRASELAPNSDPHDRRCSAATCHG